MRLLHFVEIENFKGFGEKQRIELDHPAVLIGPNNCGKTSAIQALALWSQALRTWFEAKKESSATERSAIALNRLNIVSVPVQRTRYFWHNTQVRLVNQDIQFVITVGVWFSGKLHELSMRFRNQGDELVYCRPDDQSLKNLDLLRYTASIRVELLYPMSGLETEETILKPGRIDVLLGQGQTAQVLRNLCLIVFKDSPQDWKRIQDLMLRLFEVRLDEPKETVRGAIELQYRQDRVKEPLDIVMAGRGFQQMLLIFSYLYSHKGSVLLVDEPDAHLEILRQKQVYVLLRDIAHDNGSQVVIVTHSEVILEEALDNNLTLLVDNKAENLAAKKQIRNTLKQFGTAHYVKARDRGYILYVEGGTDVDLLYAFALRLQHPVLKCWDERINSFYVQNNYPDQSMDSELERVEGAFGVTPKEHFFALQSALPGLRGLAILDSDRQTRSDWSQGGLDVVYWRKYEPENYFVRPEVLRSYATNSLNEFQLFGGYRTEIESCLSELILERVFGGKQADFEDYQSAAASVKRLVWDTATERIKLSDFAEEFFRRLNQKTGTAMLLSKGGLHRLMEDIEALSLSDEVSEKLNLLAMLFQDAQSRRNKV